MYDEITQADYRERLQFLIDDLSDQVLFGSDILTGTLESKKYADVLPLVGGPHSYTETLGALCTIIDTLEKDKLYSKTAMKYYLDEYGQPTRTTKEYYALLITGNAPDKGCNCSHKQTTLDNDEIPYGDISENKENVEHGVYE